MRVDSLEWESVGQTGCDFHSACVLHLLLVHHAVHSARHTKIFGWAKFGNLRPTTDVLQAIYGL